MWKGWKVFKGEALLEQCKNTGACEKTNVKVHTHVYCNEHLVSKYHWQGMEILTSYHYVFVWQNI